MLMIPKLHSKGTKTPRHEPKDQSVRGVFGTRPVHDYVDTS